MAKSKNPETTGSEIPQTFRDAMLAWKTAEKKYRAAKRDYDAKYNDTLLKSNASSAERRKAEAEVATVTERELLDETEIEARAAQALMEHMQAGVAA